jgi:hypothetical protein
MDGVRLGAASEASTFVSTQHKVHPLFCTSSKVPYAGTPRNTEEGTDPDEWDFGASAAQPSKLVQGIPSCPSGRRTLRCTAPTNTEVFPCPWSVVSATTPGAM